MKVKRTLSKNIQNRNGIFYFRWTPPSRLRSLKRGIPKEVKFSLRTKDAEEASFLGHLLRRRIKTLILQIVEEAGMKSDDKYKSVSWIEHFEIPTGINTGFLPYVGAAKFISNFLSPLENIKSLDLSSLNNISPTDPSSSGREVLLSQVIKEYIEEKNGSNRWTEKSLQENKSSFALILKIIGDLPISQIGTREVKYFINTIRALPPNINKIPKYKNLSPKEILALPNIPSRNRVTADKDINRLGSLFEFAICQEYVHKNVVRGKIFQKHKNAAGNLEPRNAFSVEDLKLLFFDPRFLNQLINGKLRPHHVWVPLIGLFTGARLNEICQLSLSDLKQLGEVWCFDFNNREGRRLKNQNSGRLTPIHNKLLELGLIEYSQQRQKTGKARLFPELKETRDGHSASMSKWFSNHRERLGIDRNKCFHSFRHTFISCLQNKGHSDSNVGALVGHNQKSITFGTYGGKGDKTEFIQRLKEIVDQVHYNLDFSSYPSLIHVQ